MESFLIAVVSMAVVLGIMILVHEFGHYAAAKYFGVRVDVFSIGFGKRLAGFRRGDTDYRISALPLGGYVKMAGENPLESRSGAPDEFMSHPRWQRFVIAVAGPAMNIILAIALLTGVFMVHYEHPLFLDEPAVVGWVMDNSPAAKAGIEQGDRIVRIDGQANPTWEDVLLKVMISSKQPVSVAIQRGHRHSGETDSAGSGRLRRIWHCGMACPISRSSSPNSSPTCQRPRLALKVGDEIVAVNGTPVRSLTRSSITCRKRRQTRWMVASRQGQQIHFNMTPVYDQGRRGLSVGFRLGAGTRRQAAICQGAEIVRSRKTKSIRC